MFLAPGHPQDGQVVFYKVSSPAPPTVPPSPAPRPSPPGSPPLPSLDTLMPADQCGPRPEVGRGLRPVAGADGHPRWLLPLLQGGSSSEPPTLSQGQDPGWWVGRGGRWPSSQPSRLTRLLGYVARPRPAHCPIQVRGNKPSCLLAQQNRGKLFTVYKPNIGRQSQLESLDSLSRRFHRVGPQGRLCALNAPMSSSPQAAPCR